MQYAVSDIHGRYDKYAELLRRIDLKPFDTLYVLGDMIDRGPDCQRRGKNVIKWRR